VVTSALHQRSYVIRCAVEANYWRPQSIVWSLWWQNFLLKVLH